MGLDATAVKVEVLNSSGVWIEKTLTTDYTVDRTNGIINFTSAPGVSPVTGEDNVRITAYRTVSGYADRIKKCTTGILYGVNGAMDRLFLTGNPDYPNQDLVFRPIRFYLFCRYFLRKTWEVKVRE